MSFFSAPAIHVGHRWPRGSCAPLAGDRFEVVSAGTEETPLDPDAVAVMREVGIDISGQETKAVNRFLGRRFNYVVMLCDREKERSCPIFPAQSGACSGILRTLRRPVTTGGAPRGPAPRSR